MPPSHHHDCIYQHYQFVFCRAPRFKASRRPPTILRISLSPFEKKIEETPVSKCTILTREKFAKNLYSAREDAAKSGGEAETAFSGRYFAQIVESLAPSACGPSKYKGEREKSEKDYILV